MTSQAGLLVVFRQNQPVGRLAFDIRRLGEVFPGFVIRGPEHRLDDLVLPFVGAIGTVAHIVLRRGQLDRRLVADRGTEILGDQPGEYRGQKSLSGPRPAR